MRLLLYVHDGSGQEVQARLSLFGILGGIGPIHRALNPGELVLLVHFTDAYPTFLLPLRSSCSRLTTFLEEVVLHSVVF